MTDTQSLIRDIVNGNLDDDLDTLNEAIRMRRDIRGQLKYIEFSVGQKVRFVEGTRPSYLVGSTATIIRKARSKVVVQLDTAAGRFQKAPITCPTNLLEAI